MYMNLSPEITTIPQFCYVHKPLEMRCHHAHQNSFSILCALLPKHAIHQKCFSGIIELPAKSRTGMSFRYLKYRDCCRWPLVEAAHRDIFHQFHLLIDGKGHLDSQPFAF